MTLKKVFTFLALGLVLFCVAAAASPVFAQQDTIATVSDPVISPSSIWYEVWTIIQPVVVLAVSTVGPLVVAWLAGQLSGLMRVTDEKKKLEVEAQLRSALHDSALNALKFAVAKLGYASAAGNINPAVIKTAIEYVRDKNPTTLEKLGVNTTSLEEIIMSKIPDVVSAAKSPPK